MKYLTGIIVLSGLVALTLYYNSSSLIPIKKGLQEKDKPNLRQIIEGRGEHEFLYTHDPATQTIPKERLMRAKLLTRNLLRQKAAIPNVQWQERGPNNVSGRTRGVLVDAGDATGNTLFAGGVGGGLWKTTDGGNTWSQIDDFLDNLAVNGITQDVNNSDIIYFGTGEGFGNADAIRGLGIWKSTDGGTTFNQLAATDNNSSFYFVNSMATVDSAGTTIVLAANSNAGVQRSIDGGTTWTQVLSGDGKDLTVASNGDIYAGMDNHAGIFKSTDHGDTWTNVYDPPPGAGRIELAAAPSNANVVYAIIEATFQNQIPSIRKTTDGGLTWPLLPNPTWNDQNCLQAAPDWTRGQDWYDLIAAVDPNNSDRVFIGAIDLFVTDNGGSTWNQISSWAGACGRQYVHADQHALVFVGDSSDDLWSGNDGGVYRTTNATAAIPSFEFKSVGYNVTQFYACDIHPGEGEDYFLAGSQDNGTQQFTDPGLNNTNEPTGGDGGFCHIDQDNSLVQITSFTRNNYNISTNGGLSFSAGPRFSTGLFINPTDYDDEIKKLYGAYNSGTFLRWNDPSTGGDNSEIVTVTGMVGTATHVRTSPNVSDRVYFGHNSTVTRVDGASTGTTKAGTVIFSGFGGGTISCVEIENGNEDHMLVIKSNYGVVSIYESTNATSGSPTWTNIENNLPDIPIRWGIFNPDNPDQVLLATELGIWSTDDLDGVNTEWTPTNTGFANTRIDMIKYRESDHTVIAASHGRGLFSTVAFNNQLFFKKDVVEISNELDTLTYCLEVFNNTLATATNVTITDVLDTGLVYVTGSLTCGSIAGSTITINQASLAQGDTLKCTFQAVAKRGNFSNIFFDDDNESGTSNWMTQNGQGAAVWSLVNTNPYSPSNSWYAPNTGQEDNTEYLILDPIVLETNSQFGFWHYYDTEFGWDGGIVEISTDGGSNWDDLGPLMTENGYNSVLGQNQNSDIANRAAFSGNSDGYIFTTIDLSSYGTASVQIRFLFGEDDNTSEDGWYVDDVLYYTPYEIPNIACVTTDQGHSFCDTTATLIFECMVDCFRCDDGIMNGSETGVDCGGDTCTPCDCTDTDPNLMYDNTTIPDGTDKRIMNNITTMNDVDISNGSSVILRAGNIMEFDPGFEVDPGGAVELLIDDCNELPPARTDNREERKQ